MPDVRIPKMSQHKASGQAVVRLGGRDFYLGAWGTKIAHAEYDRLVGEWLAGGRHSPAAHVDGLNIAQLLSRFWDHATKYYRHPDGTPTTEILCFRDAFRPLRQLYGHTPAAAFGPLALKAVRHRTFSRPLRPLMSSAMFTRRSNVSLPPTLNSSSRSPKNLIPRTLPTNRTGHGIGRRGYSLRRSSSRRGDDPAHASRSLPKQMEVCSATARWKLGARATASAWCHPTRSPSRRLVPQREEPAMSASPARPRLAAAEIRQHPWCHHLTNARPWKWLPH